MTKQLSRDDYKVAWICPLVVEQIAAMEMLDEEHEALPQSAADHNVYSLGSINGHNIVIAGLHQPGNCPAATVVAQMRMSFPALRFGLLVGIGGGVPVQTDDGMIRLGHVVVSKPDGEHSGAVQYDHGKARDGQFQRTGVLAPPPAVLLNAAQALAVRRARIADDPVQLNVRRINTSLRTLQGFRFPGVHNDHLYPRHYTHIHQGVPCAAGCDPSKRVPRASDDDEAYVTVHRGNIASGELVVKDASLRDALAQQHRLLCFEMEAAGVTADFPCIVVRGISDYCDSHKNDQWHGYAAAVAAAYARQLFFHMPVDEVQRRPAHEAQPDSASFAVVSSYEGSDSMSGSGFRAKPDLLASAEMRRSEQAASARERESRMAAAREPIRERGGYEQSRRQEAEADRYQPNTVKARPNSAPLSHYSGPSSSETKRRREKYNGQPYKTFQCYDPRVIFRSPGCGRPFDVVNAELGKVQCCYCGKKWTIWGRDSGRLR